MASTKTRTFEYVSIIVLVAAIIAAGLYAWQRKDPTGVVYEEPIIDLTQKVHLSQEASQQKAQFYVSSEMDQRYKLSPEDAKKKSEQLVPR